MKSSSLRIRPLYVYSENHVRGHVLLCMLAYYVEWHLRIEKRHEEDPGGFVRAQFHYLMDDLATLSLNEVTLPGNPDHRFSVMTEPTVLQQRAFELLGVDPGKLVSSKIRLILRMLLLANTHSC